MPDRAPPRRIALLPPMEHAELARGHRPLESPIAVPALVPLKLSLWRRGPLIILRCNGAPELYVGGAIEAEAEAPLSAETEVLHGSGCRLALDAQGDLQIWGTDPPMTDFPPPALNEALIQLSAAVRMAVQQAGLRQDGQISAGLILRFGEPASWEIIRRGLDPVGDTIDRWWKALPPEAPSGLGWWCEGLAAALIEEAADLLEEPLPEEEGWKATVVSILQRRDELACGVVVLQRCAPDQLPRPQLRALDPLLIELLDHCYAPLGPLGPLLDEVGRRGGGYWARPGRHRGRA
jgi:hypothetical protein